MRADTFTATFDGAEAHAALHAEPGYDHRPSRAECERDEALIARARRDGFYRPPPPVHVCDDPWAAAARRAS